MCLMNCLVGPRMCFPTLCYNLTLLIFLYTLYLRTSFTIQKCCKARRHLQWFLVHPSPASLMIVRWIYWNWTFGPLTDPPLTDHVSSGAPY